MKKLKKTGRITTLFLLLTVSIGFWWGYSGASLAGKGTLSRIKRAVHTYTSDTYLSTENEQKLNQAGFKELPLDTGVLTLSHGEDSPEQEAEPLPETAQNMELSVDQAHILLLSSDAISHPTLEILTQHTCPQQKLYVKGTATNLEAIVLNKDVWNNHCPPLRLKLTLPKAMKLKVKANHLELIGDWAPLAETTVISHELSLIELIGENLESSQSPTETEEPLEKLASVRSKIDSLFLNKSVKAQSYVTRPSESLNSLGF